MKINFILSISLSASLSTMSVFSLVAFSVCLSLSCLLPLSPSPSSSLSLPFSLSLSQSLSVSLCPVSVCLSDVSQSLFICIHICLSLCLSVSLAVYDLLLIWPPEWPASCCGWAGRHPSRPAGSWRRDGAGHSAASAPSSSPPPCRPARTPLPGEDMGKAELADLASVAGTDARAWHSASLPGWVAPKHQLKRNRVRHLTATGCGKPNISWLKKQAAGNQTLVDWNKQTKKTKKPHVSIFYSISIDRAHEAFQKDASMAHSPLKKTIRCL